MVTFSRRQLGKSCADNILNRLDILIGADVTINHLATSGFDIQRQQPLVIGFPEMLFKELRARARRLILKNDN